MEVKKMTTEDMREMLGLVAEWAPEAQVTDDTLVVVASLLRPGLSYCQRLQ